MTKNELRTQYKSLRRTLSAESVASGSLQIANRVLALPVWEARCFHVFMPIAAQHEVDTEVLLNILLGRDKTVVVSRTIFSERRMEHFVMDESTTFIVNKYGIPEPANGIPVSAKEIDVVFVPLLAFDLAGHRVGYGKGVYDEFLRTCRPDVCKIGLSFFEAVAAIDDVWEGDEPLDYCVTPEKTYRFN